MDRRDFIKYGTVLAGVGGACLFCKNGGVFFKEHNAEIKSPQMDTRPCIIPFVYCEIYNNKGDINPCCPAYLKYNNLDITIEEARFKNIYDNSEINILDRNFDDVWNGELYTNLRQSVLNGDFSMCKRDLCPMYVPCSVDEIPADYKKGPKDLKISYDYECNYNCITCRDTIKTNSPEEMSLYENVYLPKIIKIAKNADAVILLGSGEPLFSRHSRRLMQELIKIYPKIRFDLCTNGFFLDEKNLTELGIQNNIRGILVSVNAVKRETYKKILRTDAFDRVMKNLELMAEWKKQGKIDYIRINFILHLMNYKELPEFIKLAQKLDVTALVTTYRPWPGAELHKRYNEVAVFEQTNPHYIEFTKIMHDPVFKDKEHCLLEPRLLDIANS